MTGRMNKILQGEKKKKTEIRGQMTTDLVTQECGVGCGCWETAKPKVSEKGIMNRGHSMSKGTEEYTHTYIHTRIYTNRRKIIKTF